MASLESFVKRTMDPSSQDADSEQEEQVAIPTPPTPQKKEEVEEKVLCKIFQCTVASLYYVFANVSCDSAKAETDAEMVWNSCLKSGVLWGVCLLQ